LRSEFTAWAGGFSATERFHLLRVLASLARSRRLAETYTDRINRLFPPRVEALGRALGVLEHAVKVFSEGDVRGHVVFQLSRLVDLGLQTARHLLQLPPWEAVVPGEAVGRLVRVADLREVEGQGGPLLLLLERVDGDAEIPSGVRGIALGHPLPHLSHLGVRARQAGVPFAACAAHEHLADFEHLVGKWLRLRVTPEGLTMQETAKVPSRETAAASAGRVVAVPEVTLAGQVSVLRLDQARPETCGAKATAARRLVELAGQSAGLFHAPRGLAIPFGIMEQSLEASPDVGREYHAIQERLQQAQAEELETLLPRLCDLVYALAVPVGIQNVVTEFFRPDARLAVRSSANGEDLENLAGAGLYESVVNVSAAAVPEAIKKVWASLWTRRATISRIQAGIPYDRLHMAVLLQELVVPDLSFIMHTANPLTGERGEAVVELAVGLGETLASSPFPGTPYRLLCPRTTLDGKLLACGTFSFALRPSPAGSGKGVIQERLDFSRIPLSTDPSVAPHLGKQLAQLAVLLENAFGRPQDVEGACVGDTVYLVQTRPQQGL
jgi:phosphoglucan,water dikinase